MKIVIVDPGCSGPAGHNGSMFEEFGRELPALGFAPTYLVSRRTPPGALAAPGVEVQALFAFDGYARQVPAFIHEHAFAATLASIEAELRCVDWRGVGAVLMPTVYPLHLIALARVLPTVVPADTVRVSLGFLMPVSFWVQQAEVAASLGAMMLSATQLLQQHGPTLAYAESGRYAFGNDRLELPQLLPPVSRESDRLVAELRRQAETQAGTEAAARQALRFGFFGSAFTSKGITLLHQAVQQCCAAGDWPHRIDLVLPAGATRIVDAFGSCGPQVRANSRTRSNTEFLQAMAAVDVVLLPYDPAHYGDKLSGVLFEALALGKPVVVTDGCAPLVQWLDQTAPGSYAACAYDPAALADVLKLPAQAWQAPTAAARSSATLVSAAKSMRRYLACAGIVPPRSSAAIIAPGLVSSHADTRPPSSGATPLVSIVIPAWNRAPMIEAAIESACRQSVREIEIIVMDNASSDDTEAVARRCAAADPRVQVYRNASNIGPVRNWIEGIRRARAPFVKILFSDDLIDSRFVERMLPPLLDPDVAFSFCPAVVGEEPWQGKLFYAAFDRATQLSREAFESMSLAAIGQLPLSPGAALFRRADLLQSLRTHLDGVVDYDFSATGSGVDWLTYLLTARRYARVAFHHEPLAFFRAHPGSLTIGDSDGKVWRGYQIAARWFVEGGAATA